MMKSREMKTLPLMMKTSDDEDQRDEDTSTDDEEQRDEDTSTDDEDQ